MSAELLPGILFIMVAVTAACHIPHAVHVVSHFVWHRLAALALRRPRVAVTIYSFIMGGSVTFIGSHATLYLYEGITCLLVAHVA